MPDYDFYKVLNVARDASADEIKKAYKKEVLHARELAQTTEFHAIVVRSVFLQISWMISVWNLVI
jgi:DnaJ-domain-containing protein 1